MQNYPAFKERMKLQSDGIPQRIFLKSNFEKNQQTAKKSMQNYRYPAFKE